MSEKIITKFSNPASQLDGAIQPKFADDYEPVYIPKEKSVFESGTSRTFVYWDLGKTIYFDNASPCEYIIPYVNSSLLENGGWVRIIQRGAGTVTVKSDDAWVHVNDFAKPTANVPGQYKEIFLRCLDRGENWIATGNEVWSAQPLADEVQLTISGMTGSNWNGLGNGVHSLDGREIASSQTHAWYSHPDDNPDRLKLKASLSTTTGTTTTTYYYSQWQMYYGAYYSYYYYTSLSTVTTGGAPSIGNRLFTSCTLNGVTFAWAKGSAWSRGGM